MLGTQSPVLPLPTLYLMTPPLPWLPVSLPLSRSPGLQQWSPHIFLFPCSPHLSTPTNRMLDRSPTLARFLLRILQWAHPSPHWEIKLKCQSPLLWAGRKGHFQPYFTIAQPTSPTNRSARCTIPQIHLPTATLTQASVLPSCWRRTQEEITPSGGPAH